MQHLSPETDQSNPFGARQGAGAVIFENGPDCGPKMGKK
jgi:hypothetical protein